jgi:hypothetical protein
VWQRAISGYGSIVIATLLAGCSGDPDTTAAPANNPNQITDAQLKERLEYIGQTGQAGSALAGMREALESGGHKNMLPELDQLQKAQRPADVKRIAKAMAAKL